MSYSTHVLRKTLADALKALREDEVYQREVPKAVRALVEADLKHYCDRDDVQCVDVQVYGQEPHLTPYQVGHGANHHISISIQHPE